MLNNNLSWINLNVGSGGGGTGGVSDYNDLANRPIKSLQGTSQNPISLWNLGTGLYLLNGYINYDVNNSREGVNLFVSLTAQMQNGQYVMSAFVPSWEAHYEYKKVSANATDYAEHQMLKMLTQDEVLTMTNETPYTPTGDYNPSTKKYVDDSMNAVLEHLSELGVNEQDIQALITENRRRDIAIQALLNETADKNVTIEEETHTISLDYSIEDGMATVNKLEGSTLVNVSKQKEAIDITKSYDVETGNYIHLESEQDGKCKPLFEGNTAVNRAYGERNILAMPKIESVSGNEHTITNGLDGGKVEVESVKGNTLVNLANGNYWPAGQTVDTASRNTVDNGYGITITSPGSCVISRGCSALKDNTTYTLVFDVNSNFGELQYSYYDGSLFTQGLTSVIDTNDYSNGYTRVVVTRTTTTNCRDVVIGFHGAMSADKYLNVKNLMVFEGDLTQTPELIPTEYVEGLKSSFENEYISPNVTYLQGNGSIREIYNSVATCDSFKPNTTYTYFIQNNGEEPARLYINSNSMSVHQDLTINENNYKIGKCVTKEANLSTIWLSIRVTQTKPQNLKVYLLEGDWTSNPPTYEEVTNHAGEYRADVKVVGKNKFDSNEITLNTINNLVIEEDGKYKIPQGTITTWIKSNVFQLNPNTTYTLNPNTTSTARIVVMDGLYDGVDDEVYRDFVLCNTRFNYSTFQFTTNYKGTACICICTDNAYEIEREEIVFKFQLEEGTTATSYEPYKEDTYQLLLNSPLLKDDEIKVQDGWLGHYHKMGKVVLDGSEDEGWRIQDTYQENNTVCFVHSNLPYSKKAGELNFTNDRFINYRNYPLQTEIFKEGFSINTATEYGEFAYIRLDISRLPALTLDNFKQWLSENPTTVVYELAEPYFEPLVKVDSLALDIYNTNSTITIDSAVPVQQSTVKNLSYRLQGHSSPYVLDYNADGEITHEIVDDRLRVYGNGAIVEDLMMFDGSEIPKSDYFQGLKSVFEEGLVTDESDPNYGKYALELKSFTSNHVLGGTKVVYLSSPLLKGDSIEVIDGKLVHVHKMDKVVLDGSESWVKEEIQIVDTIQFWTPGYSSKVHISDKFRQITNSELIDNIEGIRIDRDLSIGINKSKLSTTDVNGFKQWLQANPTTVVYELETPWNEVISENIDDITINTYANGYLGLNTLVYPSNIKFLAFEEELTYLYTSTTYTVQFDSDGEGTIDIILGGASVLNKQVVKGKNNIQVTTPSTLTDNKLVMGGYGNYKVSNVVVTNSTKEFDYFEGMKSTFEDTQNEDGTYNVEIVVYNAPVRFGKNNK